MPAASQQNTITEQAQQTQQSLPTKANTLIPPVGQTGIMKSVTVQAPKISQLVDSPIDDKYGHAYATTFTDPATLAKIRAFHVPKHENGPYVLMRTDVQNEQEIEHRKAALEVAGEKMAKVIRGEAEKVTLDFDRTGVAVIVRAPEGITQRQVGGLVLTDYHGEFENADLKRVHYADCPKKEYAQLKRQYTDRPITEEKIDD